jgi:glycosyltransferase involved in cell wall biosynthesis
MARVLITSPDPLGASGGVERFCGLLACGLQRAGHEVRVASPLRRSGRWAMRFGVGPLVESCSVPTRFADWVPELLVTNGLLGGRRRPGVRVIHVFHGTMVGNALRVGRRELLRQRVRAGIGGGLSEAFAARGAVNVAVSGSAAREARRFYRVRVARIIPNGVDTSVFRPRPRHEARRRLGLDGSGRLALFVGRAEPRKAPEVALESCVRAGFELLVAGPRPVLGAQNLGVVDEKTLALLYSACDCVVFPTRYEACSYVALEALASGVPLVTTRAGWMEELLRGVPEYGTLIGNPTADDFTRLLRRIDDERAAVAVRRAVHWVRLNNSLETFAASWNEVVTAALRRTPGLHQTSSASSAEWPEVPARWAASR